jgi:hypothetical protein
VTFICVLIIWLRAEGKSCKLESSELVRHKVNPYVNGRRNAVFVALSMGKSTFFFKLILFVTRCTDLFLRSTGPRMSLEHQYYIEQIKQKPIRMSTIGEMFQEKSTQSRLQELRFNRKPPNVACRSDVSREIHPMSLARVMFQ